MGWFGENQIAFPPVEMAEPDGLLMLGGETSAEWMLEGYRRGVFLWPICFGRKQMTAWFAPDPRAIIEFDGLHVARSLRRRLHKGGFEVRYDTAFREVVDQCSMPRGASDGIWITASMKAAYQDLFHRGFAHSVETWRDNHLVGGVFGVALNGLFAAESMFFRETDASKVALVHLVDRLRERGFTLMDIQVWSPHTGRMGAIEIGRKEYQQRLSAALRVSPCF